MIIILIFLLITSCSSYINETNETEVYALSDYLHNGVIIKRKINSKVNHFTYYSFVSLEYYLYGRTDGEGLYRAFTGQSDSAVEIAVCEGEFDIDKVVKYLPYAQIPDAWLFYVSEENISNGLEFIKREMFGKYGNKVDERNYFFHYEYYLTEKKWTAFYSCASFSADFLYNMGIPVKPGWYTYNCELFRMQMDLLTKQINFTNTN